MSSKLRHQNKVPVRSLSPTILVAVIVLMGAMPWVYFKNQLVAGGRVQRGLEERLTELAAHNRALEARIASLSSRKALQERLDTGVIAMVPLEGQAIVKIDPRWQPAVPHIVGGQSQLVPVVNQEVRR
ncbi:MAG TPA: hypothetical protein VNQ90_06075 [Chthoniobacteraceae bacterium]|nr:hypothetical protein [Chthoniobacteraceae bacterium]